MPSLIHTQTLSELFVSYCLDKQGCTENFKAKVTIKLTIRVMATISRMKVMMATMGHKRFTHFNVKKVNMKATWVGFLKEIDHERKLRPSGIFLILPSGIRPQSGESRLI